MNKAISFSLLVLGGVLASAQQKTDTIKHKKIDDVELFGEKHKQPQGLETITRLPLKPRDQIQSISIISNKVIEQLGGLNLSDVAKNVPGVTLFSSYGGNRESMTIRGYRGVPVLKNGVAQDSDFRTASILTDMQGVESIQVIKGSAAITQGVGNGLGSAGGVINVVTKIPKFVNETNVGLRYGSWNTIRPTLDFQRVLDNNNRLAVRLNASYTSSDGFRKLTGSDRFYINPSFVIKPDDKTSIIVEMDYMKDNSVVDPGTVNLGQDTEYKVYDLPLNQYLGFNKDYSKVSSYNFSTRVNRKLTDKLSVRLQYMASSYDRMTEGVYITPLKSAGVIVTPNLRNRAWEKYGTVDENKTLQFDFIGQDIKTGSIKHTFQIGADYKDSNITTSTFTAYRNDGTVVNTVDQIDVTQNISNDLPYDIHFNNPVYNTVKTPTYGLLAQAVTEWLPFLKTNLGVRYSKLNGRPETEQEVSAWNPSFGLIVSPLKNVNIFGSYTNTTSLRSANFNLEGGGIVGPSTTAQWEAGVKSDWFNERLRANITLFSILTDNLSYNIVNPNGSVNRNLYGLAGDLKRKGVELEVLGKITNNWQVMAGWAYLDAQYQNSPAYMDGSRPMNAPKHTANAWMNYQFSEGTLKGFGAGAGVYYVGERLANEYTRIVASHNTVPGTNYFDFPSYTTVDAQLNYSYKGKADIRLFINNIFDTIGYTSYFRGGFINRTAPRNISVQLNYKF
ncbi:ferrichrome-iron receptor [Chryseobacterium angstadtii]|uniref:Ferrichrome-iron receptor n=1 Tax=Chryseobacterium angstadtii TaxID=558151 RepID=A0A0J7IJB1_9FLAO|nr:TonB-dependent siderophore receptor [Chryseobacterium angstadtii]KMQ66187.1 ferrichrome-iron receptor [Chryseobacterium angstadtii]